MINRASSETLRNRIISKADYDGLWSKNQFPSGVIWRNESRFSVQPRGDLTSLTLSVPTPTQIETSFLGVGLMISTTDDTPRTIWMRDLEHPQVWYMIDFVDGQMVYKTTTLAYFIYSAPNLNPQQWREIDAAQQQSITSQLAELLSVCLIEAGNGNIGSFSREDATRIMKSVGEAYLAALSK